MFLSEKLGYYASELSWFKPVFKYEKFLIEETIYSEEAIKKSLLFAFQYQTDCEMS